MSQSRFLDKIFNLEKGDKNFQFGSRNFESRKKALIQELKERKEFASIVLFLLALDGPQKPAYFISKEDTKVMNKNTFYGNTVLGDLLSQKLVSVDESEYSITNKGFSYAIRKIEEQELDPDSEFKFLISEKRIQSIIEPVRLFLSSYGIIEPQIQAKFLEIISNTYMESDNIQDLFRVALFITLNHPYFYPEHSISMKDFFLKYNISLESIRSNTFKILLNKLSQNSKNKIYSIEYKNFVLYIHSLDELGEFIESVTDCAIKNLYFLNQLNSEENVKFVDIITNENITNEVLKNIGQQVYTLFHTELKEAAKGLISQFLNPYIALGYRLKGENEMYLNNRRAFRYFLKAVEYDPTNMQILMEIAAAAEYVNKEDKVLEIYDKAVELKPNDHNLRFTRGYSYYNNGEYKKALDDFNVCIELNMHQEFPYLWLLKGNVHMIRDELDIASFCFKSYAFERPDDPKGWERQGDVYYRKKDYVRSAELFEKACKMSSYPNIDTLFELADSYNNSGQETKTTNTYTQILEKKFDIFNPKYDPYYDLNDEINRFKPKFESSLEFFEEIVKKDPSDPVKWYNLATIEGVLGNDEKVWEYLDKAISLDDQYAYEIYEDESDIIRKYIFESLLEEELSEKFKEILTKYEIDDID